MSGLGRHEEALRAFDRALELRDDDFDALEGKGRALSGLGEHEKALPVFDRALNVDRYSPQAHLGKGRALVALGCYEEALRALDGAVELDPESPEAWMNRGRALEGLGRYEEALRVFDRASVLNPDSPQAWVGKGRALVALGRYEGALETFRWIDRDRENAELCVKDPDPISLGFLIFAAVISSSSLIISMANRIDTQRIEAERRRGDEGEVRKYLGRVDRALNKLDEGYRSLVSVCDQEEVLATPFSLGVAPIYADQQLAVEIDRLRNIYFDAGKDLEESLDELSSRVGREMQLAGQETIRRLMMLFDDARTSATVVQFMVDVGRMLELISNYVEQVGERYDYKPISAGGRQAALDATVRRLEQLDRRSPSGE